MAGIASKHSTTGAMTACKDKTSHKHCVRRDAPIGSTRRRYASLVMLCDLTTLKTRTHRKPTVEQKSMCHAVSAMGYGKPENASSHLLNRMTEMEMDIHIST